MCFIFASGCIRVKKQTKTWHNQAPTVSWLAFYFFFANVALTIWKFPPALSVPLPPPLYNCGLRGINGLQEWIQPQCHKCMLLCGQDYKLSRGTRHARITQEQTKKGSTIGPSSGAACRCWYESVTFWKKKINKSGQKRATLYSQ